MRVISVLYSGAGAATAPGQAFGEPAPARRDGVLAVTHDVDGSAHAAGDVRM